MAAGEPPSRLRIVWRRHSPSDGIDHERLWFLVGLATLAVGVPWLLLSLPVPVCRFHELTGLPCATCGGTRAVLGLLHGEFFQALRWNPLVILVGVSAMLFLGYAVVVLIFNLPRLRVEGFAARHGRFLAWTFFLLLLGNWAYVLATQ